MKKRKILSIPVFIAVYLGVIAACIALDQLTKLWIFDGLLKGDEYNSVQVLGNFMVFEALYNDGAAFGMAQSDAANVVFFIITIVGVPLFAYLLWRSRTRSVVGQIGFAFIVGGTIGNAIDRGFVHAQAGKFFSGTVRDFISFSIFPPIFNVADSFLTIGVILAIVAIIFLDPDSLLGTIKKERKDKMTAQNGTSEAADTENALQQEENLPSAAEISKQENSPEQSTSAEKTDEKN